LRTLIKTVAVLAVIVAALGFGAYRYAARSLPTLSGTISVKGISAPVEIIRDRDAIPHIFGATKLDALYGLGYVHAQDRLWQMEFQRRIGFGRLSEIFGETTVPQDRFLRTVGFGRAARSAWDHLPEQARTEIDAYVAGVNAFLETRHGSALPPEFSLLGFQPEPWSGPDVIAWVKMMAWDLSANYPFEMLRHDLTARVGAERAAELMRPYPVNGLNILGGPIPGEDINGEPIVDRPSTGSGLGTPHAAAHASGARGMTGSGPEGAHDDNAVGTEWSGAFAAALSGGNPAARDFIAGKGLTEGLGSNNWVVDGTMTASGKPLLANDPHLGTRIPSLWYLAHMTAGDFDVIGSTLPGAPAMAIGRNRYIAWGETNMFADVEDLYRERLDASGKNVEFAGALEPIRTITETINVSGRSPIDVTVRFTRHGPLVSDAINANNQALPVEPKPPVVEPLAFRWTALDDRDDTIVAFLRLNEARNWNDFTAALRPFAVPSQNFVYADVDGHIGYYAPGRIPIRARGDGASPADGWTGEMEWTGWIPFDELPHAYDPPAHFLVTANNRPVPADYPYFIGVDFLEPFRAQRITNLLHSKSGWTPDAFRAMQSDTVSLHATTLVPLLLERARPVDTADVQAVNLLRHWNFDMRGDRAEPAIFEAWFIGLARSLIVDELGRTVTDAYERRFTYVHRFLEGLLTGAGSRWCDDVRTPQQETCDDAVNGALHDAVSTLRLALGDDVQQWRWDAVHHAVFPHALDSVAPLRLLLDRSVPNGGDWSTINVGPTAVDRPFNQTEVPGYRQIVDLSPAHDSRFLDAVGQSGHFLSPHYDDFLDDWQAVRHKPMRMDRAEIERGAIGKLTLMPR